MRAETHNEGHVTKRTGTLLNKKSAKSPRTIGARLTALRLAMDPVPSQGEIAERVLITHKGGKSNLGRKLHDTRPLTRPGYHAYEHDRAIPTIDVIEQLARIFNSTPEYIAWGRGAAHVVAERVYDAKTDTWENADQHTWNLDASWLADSYGIASDTVAIVVTPRTTGAVVAGEALVVDTKAEPKGAGGVFAYGNDDGVHVHRLTREGDKLKIGTGAKARHEQIEDLNVLGRVLGRITLSP